MKKIILFLVFGVLTATTVSIQSCVKKGHDEPEDQTGFDPQIPVTHTIAQLLAMPINTTITENVVVSGIVVMDDRSGNYYKKFVIQDTTGGLEINLDQNNIYNDYPIGRKVYVKCKGLSMASYGGMKQLGFGVDERMSIVSIPFAQADAFIVKANYPNPIKVDTFTYDQLSNTANNEANLNRLVAIKNTQFPDAALGLPYAQANTTTNRTLQGCGATTSNIVLRTSNYSKFQNVIVPSGGGVIVGLYTKYNTTPQLFIRDTSDVNFRGVRCDGSSPNDTYILNDQFTSLANWTPVSVTGAQTWATTSYGNPAPCAIMTGFASGAQYENEDWLISKPFDLTSFSSIKLNFQTAARYGGDVLKVYVSTNYTTGLPSTATWTELTATMADVNASAFIFTPSGDIDLTPYKTSNNVRIAFKYVSTTTTAATWELDNVKIQGQ